MHLRTVTRPILLFTAHSRIGGWCTKAYWRVRPHLWDEFVVSRSTKTGVVRQTLWKDIRLVQSSRATFVFLSVFSRWFQDSEDDEVESNDEWNCRSSQRSSSSDSFQKISAWRKHHSYWRKKEFRSPHLYLWSQFTTISSFRIPSSSTLIIQQHSLVAEPITLHRKKNTRRKKVNKEFFSPVQPQYDESIFRTYQYHTHNHLDSRITVLVPSLHACGFAQFESVGKERKTTPQ